MEKLAKRSATQLVKAIKDKQISSVELVELFMERYHRLNPIRKDQPVAVREGHPKF